jgi:hypothetical protein
MAAKSCPTEMADRLALLYPKLGYYQLDSQDSTPE